MRMMLIAAFVASPTLAAAEPLPAEPPPAKPLPAEPPPDASPSSEEEVDRDLELQAEQLVKRRGVRFVGRTRLAGAVHGYFDTPLYGLEAELSLGVRLPSRRFLVAPTLRYGRAETNRGLNAHRGTIGGLLAWQHDGVLVGVEPAFNVLVIERYTTDSVLFGLGVGADLVVDVDLVGDEAGNALFLGFRGGTHYIPHGLHYGGSLGLGARFGP